MNKVRCDEMIKEVKEKEIKKQKFRVCESCLVLGRQIFQELEPRDSIYRVTVYLIDKLKNMNESKNGERDLEKITIGDALLVLLLTWHSAFYRYGTPKKFHKNIDNFLTKYKKFIISNEEINEKDSKDMFKILLDYLKVEFKVRCSDGKKIRANSLYHILSDYFKDVSELKAKLKEKEINFKKGAWIACDDLSEFLKEYGVDSTIISNGITMTRKSGIAIAKTLHLIRRDFFPLWDSNIARAYLGCNVNTKSFENYWKFKKIVDEQKKDFECWSAEDFYKCIDEFNYVIFTRSKINKDKLEKLFCEFKKKSKKCIDDLNVIVGDYENIFLRKFKFLGFK